MPGLSDRHALRRQLLLPYVIRIMLQKAFTYGRKFPVPVQEHFSVNCHGQVLFRNLQPLHKGFRAAGTSQERTVEFPNRLHTDMGSIGTPDPPSPGRVVTKDLLPPGFQRLPLPSQFLREPEKIINTPVMILGNLIIIAKAVRPIANQSSGKARKQLRVIPLQPGQHSIPEISSAQIHALHTPIPRISFSSRCHCVTLSWSAPRIRLKSEIALSIRSSASSRLPCFSQISARLCSVAA